MKKKKRPARRAIPVGVQVDRLTSQIANLERTVAKWAAFVNDNLKEQRDWVFKATHIVRDNLEDAAALDTLQATLGAARFCVEKMITRQVPEVGKEKK